MQNQPRRRAGLEAGPLGSLPSDINNQDQSTEKKEKRRLPVTRQYDLIERVRPQLERHGDRTWAQRAFRRAIFALFTHPARLRALDP